MESFQCSKCEIINIINMTDQQIEIYNIAMTDFMGYKLTDPEYPTDGYWFKHDELFDHSDYLEWAETKDGFILIPPCFMLFHKDWNWIMAVIKKINEVELSLFTGDKRTLWCSFSLVQQAVSTDRRASCRERV